MEVIIVTHDLIYGSIGLYIPLSLDSRDHFFRYLFSRTAQSSNEKDKMIFHYLN